MTDGEPHLPHVPMLTYHSSLWSEVFGLLDTIKAITQTEVVTSLAYGTNAVASLLVTPKKLKNYITHSLYSPIFLLCAAPKPVCGTRHISSEGEKKLLYGHDR